MEKHSFNDAVAQAMASTWDDEKQEIIPNIQMNNAGTLASHLQFAEISMLRKLRWNMIR